MSSTRGGSWDRSLEMPTRSKKKVKQLFCCLAGVPVDVMLDMSVSRESSVVDKGPKASGRWRRGALRHSR